LKKRVVSIQANVQLADFHQNRKHIVAMLDEAKKQHNPDIIILPETWNVGFFPENVDELADEVQENISANLISDWARINQVNVVAGSIAIRENGQVKNRSFIYDRQGQCVASYDKMHLFSPGKEDEFFEHGGRHVTFELDGIPCGVIICYDLRFPELSRMIALDGAQILFVPAEWPYPRVAHWQTLARARAIENQMFVITSNGVGVAGDLRFCGHSSIIDPFGEYLAQADDQETMIFAEIDLDQVEEVRRKIPVFRDRKPELY
jgi:omega-amidase